jgi:hypothetical protein
MTVTLPALLGNAIGIFYILLIVIALIIYFLPTIILLIRNGDHKLPFFLVNLFLGWTAVVWIALMIIVWFL